MPRVSVVIPTYNRADLIPETLDSVLAQTYRDFEVIVVDDGSTDNTQSTLASYEDQIRIISQENQGLSAARNTGIREAAGDFVAFLDSDDLWMPDKLEHQMTVLESDSEFSWAYTDAEVFESETGYAQHLYSQLYHRLHRGNILAPLFLENFIATPTPIVHHAAFSEVGEFYNNELVAEDWDMWLRIAAVHPVALVDKPLARRRIHSGMKTLNRNWKTQYDRCKKTIERAVSREPERLAPLKDEAIAWLNIRMGRRLASQGNRAQARKLFGQAIRLTPGSVRPYVYWLGCLMGGPALDTAIRLRHRLRQNRAHRLSVDPFK